MLPKISIIVPVYNASETLETTLQSVLSQSIIEDIEIICIDDGSTDNSLDILNSYAQRYANIRVHTQANSGAGAARNNGIAIARGEFIAFMDADDWYPNAETLNLLYTKAKEYNVPVAGGSIEFYVDGKLFLEKAPIFQDVYFQDDGVRAYRDYQYDFYYQRFIYDRTFMLEHGLRFPDYCRFQDVPFFTKTMQLAGAFYATKAPTYCYRRERKTPKWNVKAVEGCICGLKDVLTLSKDHSLAKLHQLALYRIEHSLIWYLNGNYLKLDASLQKQIEELNQMLDRDILELDSDYIIEPLRNIREINKFKGKMYAKTKTANCIKAATSDFVPKISVIVPVYNAAPYLAECLDSLIHQTLNEIEIICVNDGSTDNSLQILDSYAQKDARIGIYSQENAGLSVTRNHGCEVARGEYIQFLDSDDYLDLHALEKAYTKAKQDNLQIVLFSSLSFGDGTCPEDEEKYAKYYQRNADYPLVYTGPALIEQQLANHDYIPNAAFYLFKKSLAEDNKISFIQGILHEDNAYTFELLLSAERAGYIPDRLHQRRIHQNSIMTSKQTFYNCYGYFRSCKHMEDFLIKREYENKLPDNVLELVYSNLANARRIYSTLKGEELIAQQALVNHEAILFKHSVIEYQQQKSEIAKLQQVQRKNDVKIKELNKSLKRSLSELKNIKEGFSFRIGRLITYIPRKVLGKN